MQEAVGDELPRPEARNVTRPKNGPADLRRTRPGRTTSGRGWMGFVRNGSYVVTGVTGVPLLPGFLVLVLVVGGMMAAWYREGR